MRPGKLCSGGMGPRILSFFFFYAFNYLISLLIAFPQTYSMIKSSPPPSLCQVSPCCCLFVLRSQQRSHSLSTKQVARVEWDQLRLLPSSSAARAPRWHALTSPLARLNPSFSSSSSSSAAWRSAGAGGQRHPTGRDLPLSVWTGTSPWPPTEQSKRRYCCEREQQRLNLQGCVQVVVFTAAFKR